MSSKQGQVDFTVKSRDIREDHLEQLAGLSKHGQNLVASPQGSKDRALRVTTLTFDDLKKWTHDNLEHIEIAKKKKVFGGSAGAPIDFNNAFLAFMESAAVDLRNNSMVVKAVEAHQAGNKAEALRLLEDSTSQITALADLWGMGFTMICDFVEWHPIGHKLMVGPYCGVFYSKDYRNPFFGVAFKGTSTLGEWITDLQALTTTRAADGHLWSAEVAKGFYYPLFSDYVPTIQTSPISMIKNALNKLTEGSLFDAAAHVTGHSLGGAYATLTYAQLLIDGGFSSKYLLGDMYTFGAPRVSRREFAKLLKANVRPPTGTTWRIVNNKDYVPKVPASMPWERDPFVHVDTGYKIYPDANPERLPSEIPLHPWPEIPSSLSAHAPSEYYKSLVFALTGKPPVLDAASRQLEFLRVVETLGGIPGFHGHLEAATALSQKPVDPESFAQHADCKIDLDTVQVCTRGTVSVGSYSGELLAWGDATGIVPASSILHWNSWDKLRGDENKWAVVAAGPTELQVHFTVKSELVAVMVVTTESTVETPQLGGTCSWSLDDEDFAAKVSAQVAKAFSASLDPGLGQLPLAIGNNASPITVGDE